MRKLTMKRARVYLATMLLAIVFVGIAFGDGPGQTTGVITTQFSGSVQVNAPADGQVLAFSGGSWRNASSPAPTSSGFDTLFGTTQGSVIYRNATTWVALAPGTTGQFLQSGGGGGNPSWGTATLASVLASGADGNQVSVTNLGDMTGASGKTIDWALGTIKAKRPVSAHTSSPVTVTTALTGNVYTTTGASGTVVFNLPAEAAGLTYTFVCDAAQILTVTANGSDVIRVGESVTAGGGSLSTTTSGRGNSITIVGASSGTWTCVALVGSTWN